MEIVQGMLSKIGEYLVELTIKQCCYLVRFKKFVGDLEQEETNLKVVHEEMEQRIERARNNTEIIKKDVEKWQTDSCNILADVEGLKDEIEAKKSCLSGWCPNWACRYWLSRKAAKKTSIMVKQIEGYNKIDKNVGRPAPRPGISAPEDFEFFRSSKDAFDNIIEALGDDETNVVVMYGMAGAGKTTLAKKLGLEVKERGIFDEVVMVAVSQTPNFRNIQSKLAGFLGVELKEGDEEERADQLYLRFTQTNTDNKRKILVILDDVWKKFNLKSKIGFPFGVENKHCKILLTTRRKDLCSAMRCQSRVPLGLLDEKEGLTLLRRYAGIDDDCFTSELKPLATQVAKECKGLPLAIAVVGSALKEKSIHEWKLVGEKLKRSKLVDVSDVLDFDEEVYACLKLSYDFLRDKETKFCFLLCSLFPEDYEISVEELIVYGMGLGLFSDINSIEDARSGVRVRLNSLKDSCLLLEANQECVKMHDVVRDVALWITSKENKMFMSKSDIGLMEFSDDKDLMRYTAIYLRSNQIGELPVDLVCPKLEFLSLGVSWRFNNLLKVSDECFKGMKALKVLSLEFADLSLKSLEFLTNLKTLQLIHCSLRDISYLGKLNKLEILCLQSSSLDELPGELIELRKLRLLDFKNLKSLLRIPSKLIRRCSQLEELYISHEWEFEDKSEQRSNASLLLELNSLSRLVGLRIRIDATCLPKDFVFPKLLRYDISVNSELQLFCVDRGSYRRSLRISNVEATSLAAFEALYGTSEYICLKNIIGCHCILPGIDQRGLRKLEYLELQDCKDLECILDTSVQHLSVNDLTLLPGLTNIRLERLPQLRSIWKRPTHHVNLQSLKSLHIDSCETLKHIFPVSISDSLVQLEELTIHKAPQLKQVFFIDHRGEENASGRDEKTIMLPKLRQLRLVCLESLTSFLSENYHSTWIVFKKMEISNCSHLMSFFYEFKIKDLREDIDTQNTCSLREDNNRCYHSLHLKENDMLQLEDLPQLKYLWKGPIHHVNLQNLKSLRIYSCERLEHIFPISIVGSLGQLEQLIIRKVDQLKQVFFMDNQSEENVVGSNGKDIMLPKLQELTLVDLKSLINFLPEGYHVSLPALEVMEISDCPNLITSFISQVKMQDQKLKTLKMGGFEYQTVIQILTCLSLRDLTELSVTECNKRRHLFSSALVRSLSQLRKLTIGLCEDLEQIIFKDDEEDHRQSEEVFGDKDGVDVMNDKETVLLPQLKELELLALPNLTSFCPGSCHLKLNLETLRMTHLPNDQVLRRILGCLRDVKELSIVACGVKEIEFGLCETSTSTSTHISTFRNLTELQVCDCYELRRIVVPLPNLLQLENLGIINCFKLEEIIIVGDDDDEVVIHKDRADDDDVTSYHKQLEVELPRLQLLLLVNLGSLVKFCPVNYHFIFPSLKGLHVRVCGKIETRFSYSRGENGRVHLHAEATTEPLKEGSHDDQDAHLPPPEPTLDIFCWSSDDLATQLPPYIEKDDEQGINQQSKTNAHDC